MIDLLVDVVLENSDVIIDFLFGVTAAVFAYKVVRKITPDNVTGLIRDALKNSRQKAFEKYLGKAIEATIVEKKANAVSFELFCAECGEPTKERLKIESSRGVDSSLVKGMKILVNA